MPVEVRDLHKTYSYVRALRGVSFTLDAGEVVGFVGPNGAGKSTTIKIIAGLVVPDRGSVIVDGVDALGNVEPRRHIGYVPEIPVAPPWARVCDFLEHLARMEGASKSEARLMVRRALERLGVGDLCNRKFKHTSKGQRKRILLAQAIMVPKKYIFLDEPITGLDPEWVAETRKLIIELKESGAGLLVSSHILRELQEVVDRVVIISRGRIVFQGSIAELSKLAGSGRTLVIRPSDIGRAVRVLEAKGLRSISVVGPKVRVVVPSNLRPAEVIEILESEGVDVVEFEYSESSLEDAYLRLVRGEVS